MNAINDYLKIECCYINRAFRQVMSSNAFKKWFNIYLHESEFFSIIFLNDVLHHSSIFVTYLHNIAKIALPMSTSELRRSRAHIKARTRALDTTWKKQINLLSDFMLSHQLLPICIPKCRSKLEEIIFLLNISTSFSLLLASSCNQKWENKLF